MKEFFDEYVKKYRKYFITSDSIAHQFLATGIITKELRKDHSKYKVYKYPGKSTPPHGKEKFLERVEKANKIGEHLILSKNGKDIVATYPLSLLYILDPELYEKCRHSPKFHMEKAKTDEQETMKFFTQDNNHEYALTNDLLVHSLYYYPLAADIVEKDDKEFEKYVIVYFPDEKQITDDKVILQKLLELPQNLAELPVEERVRIAKKKSATILLIHKKTSTPIVVPIELFIIFSPREALRITNDTNIKKINAKQYIEIMKEKLQKQEAQQEQETEE